MLNDRQKEMRKTLAFYNAIPNVLWSLINLIPVAVFCYSLLPLQLFLTLLCFSCLTIFFPRSFFDFIRIGKTTRIYKKAGVAFINRFTQNGIIINRLMTKKYPEYKAVTGARKELRKLLNQSYMFEKFHFMLFVFFSGLMIYALINQYWGWALILLPANILYNVYPILLQQYIRIRLMRMKF